MTGSDDQSRVEAGTISHALVLYTGYGVSPIPDFDPERVQGRYGSNVTVEMLPTLNALAEEFYRVKRRSRDQFRDARRAAARFSRSHPEISREAVDALTWAHAIDNR